MGQAKKMWMEMQEAQWEQADASFHCPNCNADVDGSIELPVVYDNGEEENFPVELLWERLINGFGFAAMSA